MHLYCNKLLLCNLYSYWNWNIHNFVPNQNCSYFFLYPFHPLFSWNFSFNHLFQCWQRQWFIIMLYRYNIQYAHISSNLLWWKLVAFVRGWIIKQFDHTYTILNTRWNRLIVFVFVNITLDCKLYFHHNLNNAYRIQVWTQIISVRFQIMVWYIPFWQNNITRHELFWYRNKIQKLANICIRVQVVFLIIYSNVLVFCLRFICVHMQIRVYKY